MLTRRSFLKKSSAVLAAGVMHSLFAPYEAAARKVGANDKIRVALIGCRNMGWSDLSDFMRHPEIDCVALCDIDQNILRNRAVFGCIAVADGTKLHKDFLLKYIPITGNCWIDKM